MQVPGDSIITAWHHCCLTETGYSKKFSETLQFVEILLRWIETLCSPHGPLKCPSRINRLTSDKLKSKRKSANCRFWCCCFCYDSESSNFQDDVRSNSMDIFKDFYLLMFDRTSMQDCTENFNKQNWFENHEIWAKHYSSSKTYSSLHHLGRKKVFRCIW